MTDAELDRFRHLIAARLEDLTQEDALGKAGQATVTLDQQAVGRLSRMDALQNQAMARAGQGRRSTMKARLRAALGRIEAGEFGWCDACGDAIGTGRLQLDPSATRCIDCARG